ncbi:adenosylcobalamin-dependent ribonucleoside-diphosphate reductase [Candidatus Micrarchaeota archaeon]|nr:adenosylcobalamin-dependent ribonucleoside-diphosphate reductase [Candidatus Micrarchaeota archaeon]
MVKTSIREIRKRDGRVAPFEPEKIGTAVGKAFEAARVKDARKVEKIVAEVLRVLEKRFGGSVPSVENVQDVVENVLMEAKEAKAAKAYILYRRKRNEVREAKKFLGVEDELKVSINAAAVLERRYLLKDDEGRVVESPQELFERVARTVAGAEKKHDAHADVKKIEEKFFKLMSSFKFLPNSPTLMNAGTNIGQLSACFVLPVEDSIKSIFSAVMNSAEIQQSGGGVGFSFSRLRPKGDVVKSTHGAASGPVSFMKVFDVSTDVVKQGGKRRGANMAVLRVDHSDVLDFVTAKYKEKGFENFNLSVAVTDEFMRAAERGAEYALVNPRTGKPMKTMRANDVLDLIAAMAWEVGDPGVIFIDEVNKHNPTPGLGEIESTNPCGEQPLLPFESCNLGSIDVGKFAGKGKVEWEELREAISTAVRFLDDVIDVNKFPLAETEKITKANRKIGLGVMGFADLLVSLGISYNSKQALEFAEKLASFVQKNAREASKQLAEERGVFPNFEQSAWKVKGERVRNATITTIAPTGSISIIADCSSGIEPLFAVSFVRSVMEGTKLLETNRQFEQIAKERGFYSRALMHKIAKTGSVQNLKEVPADVKELFVTALDVPVEQHVKMQAAFQKHVDNAVSKTVNMPHDATIEDVRKAFLLAFKLKCKGITVYRYGSKGEQVLSLGDGKQEEELNYAAADSDYSGGCPTPACNY